MPIPITHFGCTYCGEAFKNRHLAMEHENHCSKNPDAEENEGVLEAFKGIFDHLKGKYKKEDNDLS